MGMLFVSSITDKGVAELAELGTNVIWYRFYECPAITPQGLAPMAKLKRVRDLEFRTEGPQQAIWGDAEATALSQSPALEEIRLEGFPNLTDAFLDALPTRCPKIKTVEVNGPNDITPEAWARFRNATRK
jgi:hypothetical protein